MNFASAVADGFAEVRAHAGRTFLQALGVTLGVASVVATMGMIASGKAQSLAYYAESGGVLKGMVYPKEIDTVKTSAREKASPGLTLKDVVAIRAAIPGFDLVEPDVSRRLLVHTGLTESVYRVSGVGPRYADLHELQIERGRFLTDDDMATSSAVCVLGADRAREFFGTGDPVGKSIRLGGDPYQVAGVMRPREFYFGGGNHNNLEWMNELVLIPATAMLTRQVGSGEDRIGSIGIRLASVEAHKDAIPALKRLLLARHGVEDFEVYDRQSRLDEMNQQDRVYDITFLVCGLISLLVGGIVVANILLASFTERIREVGVRKAIGAKGWHIAVQFLVESVVVTGFGGAVGLALGVGFVHIIAILLQQPAILTPTMVVAALLSATVVGLVFGMYPAIKAARLDPVVALRYE
ncbi:MAG TPA: ABC transporter permease [Thermoanaerobaculaceae bacterium]|nr:ABC transporter permease [Thermoanaerobaculaceae bacterium]HPS76782.1 ABC transporter permease [Thermoanaerobaculaceae bacterium]